MSVMPLTPQQCQAARLARDGRFDGVFYTAVLSTGIYCRPICPARPPKEANVRYFPSAAACAQQGYRPCLRCKPDAAPAPASSATLTTAMGQLNAGASVVQVAQQLAISDRYLRKLFVTELGVAPKQYQLYQRCLLAKQLLHQTALPITQIAFASGFESVRRFNDCFAQQLKLTPSAVRAQDSGQTAAKNQPSLTLNLSYRPPYNWPWVCDFLRARAIVGLETVSAEHYGRQFYLGAEKVSFVALHQAEQCQFQVTIQLSNWRLLIAAVDRIRRMLDLNANSFFIDQALASAAPTIALNAGLRIPQFPSCFEAGVRAVLGQQVSVAAARNLVAQVVANLGERDGELYWFPLPERIAEHSLDFLKMPGQRRDTLRRLAQFCVEQPSANARDWLALKGIGPWTVDYACMRGQGDTDIWLSGDLGVKHGLAKLGAVNDSLAQPWRSYLTVQMWSQL